MDLVGLLLSVDRQRSADAHTIVELVVARKHSTSKEILLWMTPSEAPKALQASECSELLDPTGASYWIFAQRQPGKFVS